MPPHLPIQEQSSYCLFRDVSLSVQFSSVTQFCLTLCTPMDCSTPGFPVHLQLPELAQTHVHCVSDTIQPTHPLSSPSPSTYNLSQHQGFFKWVSSSHQVTKVPKFQRQSMCLFSDLYKKDEKRSWLDQSSQKLKQRQYISKCNTYASSCCLVNRSDLFLTPWAIAHQVPPSMAFPRLE